MANIIPAQSSDFEGAGTGNWVNRFSAAVAKSTTQALTGTGSLEIAASATSWGIQLNNWPGYSTGVLENHQYAISWGFWGPSGLSGTAQLRCHWRDSGGITLLREDVDVTLDGTGGWAQSPTVLSTSPPGTTHLFFELLRTAGLTGAATYYADSFVVDDAPSTGPEAYSGTGVLNVAVSDTATGSKDSAGTGSLTLATSALSAGAKSASGNGSEAITVTTTSSGTATGGVPSAGGTGSLTIAVSASVSGQKTAKGTASLSESVSSAVNGAKRVTGPGSLSATVTDAVSGFKQAYSSPSVAITVGATAGTGTKTVSGTGSLLVQVTASSTSSSTGTAAKFDYPDFRPYILPNWPIGLLKGWHIGKPGK